MGMDLSCHSSSPAHSQLLTGEKDQPWARHRVDKHPPLPTAQFQVLLSFSFLVEGSTVCFPQELSGCACLLPLPALPRS